MWLTTVALVSRVVVAGGVTLLGKFGCEFGGLRNLNSICRIFFGRTLGRIVMILGVFETATGAEIGITGVSTGTGGRGARIWFFFSDSASNGFTFKASKGWADGSAGHGVDIDCFSSMSFRPEKPTTTTFSRGITRNRANRNTGNIPSTFINR